MESRRARYRSETRQEAKDIALEQLAAAGPAGISVNAIAKRMGMTGPALYRYFSSRDDLLTELIRDAYHDLADTIEAAGRGDGRDPADRLRAMLRAFRAWGVAAPHRYLLLFGTPVPGYQAPDDTIAAATRGLTALADVIDELPGPADRASSSELDGQLAALAPTRGLTVSPATLKRAILAWTSAHGVISLEVQGQFDPMGVDPALLLEAELDAIVSGTR
jgi:AcrR family transcriptional regulator